MDSQARSKYTSILNEDWAELGYRLQDDPGLKEKIHPIFQRTNASRPPGAEHIGPQYKSETDYDGIFAEMGPILQMASNMLESPKSLEFLYQVAHSPRTVSDTGLSNRGRPCKEFGWAKPPSKSMVRQNARNALRRLSHSLTFQIGDPEANPNIGSSIAVTGPTQVNFPNGVKMNDASDKSGIASKITLNAAIIRKLVALGDTTQQKMSLQVKIAVTLCNEIAHALAHAVDWELFEKITAETDAANQAHMEGREYTLRAQHTDEPFYSNERMAEVGNCWENQVFGGKVSWSGETSDPLFVSKWPSFLTSNDDNPVVPTRGKEKQTARKYFVPFHFIQNMHLQSFWDKVKPNHLTALYIKKTIGISYSNPDIEASSTDSSEVKWPLEDGSSRASREQDGQPVPDPSELGANEPVTYS